MKKELYITLTGMTERRDHMSRGSSRAHRVDVEHDLDMAMLIGLQQGWIAWNWKTAAGDDAIESEAR